MSKILEDFESYCRENAERITPPRLAVLEIMANADMPLTAYDVLEALSEKIDSPKPPTVYRALEFLGEHGFVHRIESLNAYIACAENHKHNGSQFMICTKCQRVDEIHLCHIPEALEKQAKQKGYQLSHWNAEIYGLCAKCAN